MALDHRDSPGGTGVEAYEAELVVGKIREFALGLDADERSLFAALLAPGVAAACDVLADADVVGHGLVEWSGGWLQERLGAVLHSQHVCDDRVGRNVRILIDP